jgi:Protein of unknown function (DUF3987)
MSPIVSILETSGSANILSDRLTIEYILERLSKGFSNVAAATGGVTLNTDSTACLISPELSILLTASLSTLPILCDLWDSRPQTFTYGTRHKGEYKIKDPCLSLLGATTPEWLVSSIPHNAVGGGFTRRVNFVYAKERSKTMPWPMSNHSSNRSDLINRLRSISQLRGEFKFSDGAKPIFEKLYDESSPNENDDEATTAYKTSAWAHATKLSMIFSASRGTSLRIEKEDMELASLKVEKVSKDIPLVFRAVGESDLVSAAERILRFIEDRGYASFQEIMRTQWRHISLEDAQRVLLTFIQGGMVVQLSKGGKTVYQTVPQGGKP